MIITRTTFWRVSGAILVAGILWAIVSLSDTFQWTLPIPLTIELPPGEALTEPVPATISLTMRASGWSLMKMLVSGRSECVLHPPVVHSPSERSIDFTRVDLLQNLETNVHEAQIVSIFPENLAITVGPVATKRVPIRPAINIMARTGFGVIGPIQVQPDSVTLVGSARVLQTITDWKTSSPVLRDVHGTVSLSVPLSDTLPGVITPQIHSVKMVAEVQEIAERTIADVAVVNRETSRYGPWQLQLQPATVTVVLRGGVRELGLLDPGQVSAFVSLARESDTVGVTRPNATVSVPNISVLSVLPPQIHYVWRHE